MIRINLAKKQSKSVPFDLKNLKLSTLLDMLKRGSPDEAKPKFDLNNPLVRTAAVIGVCYWFNGYLEDIRTGELHKVDVEMSKIEKEKDGVAQRLSKIKGWEPIKKQLEEDEHAIKLKLDVVRRLLEDRDGPAKMLMQITQTIPDHVWLTDLNVNDDSVTFKGQTPGYNDVSDFIKALDGTSQFSDIALSGISEQGAGTDTKVVQGFDLIAKRRKGY